MCYGVPLLVVLWLAKEVRGAPLVQHYEEDSTTMPGYYGNYELEIAVIFTRGSEEEWGTGAPAQQVNVFTAELEVLFTEPDQVENIPIENESMFPGVTPHIAYSGVKKTEKKQRNKLDSNTFSHHKRRSGGFRKRRRAGKNKKQKTQRSKFKQAQVL